MRFENAWVNSPVHVAMLDEANLDGYGVWKRILRAVGELQEMGSGTRLH